MTAVLLAGGLYVAALMLILRAGRNLAARCERDADRALCEKLWKLPAKERQA